MEKTNLNFNQPRIGSQPQINMELVRHVLNKMKTCGVVLEMLLTSDEVNTAWMTNLFNQIFAESKVPED